LQVRDRSMDLEMFGIHWGKMYGSFVARAGFHKSILVASILEMLVECP
jgi:hypothetical protein